MYVTKVRYNFAFSPLNVYGAPPISFTMLVPGGGEQKRGELGPCPQGAQLSKKENPMHYDTKHSNRGRERAVAVRKRGQPTQ